MDEMAKPAIEVVRRARPLHSRRAGRGLPGLARAHPALVHLAPALVGAPAAGLVPRSPTSRRSTSASSRPRATAGSRRPTCSTPGSARRCGRSRRSGWPDTEAPEFQAFFPTDVLSTARDIIFLWVARMIMTSLEFTGEVPFSDVYIHSVIQAPDGRRMSKSLGTGIDPLDEIDGPRRRRAALRPARDVLDPGRPLLRGPRQAGPRPREQDVERLAADPDERRRRRRGRPGERDRVEDRWIASRLQRAIASVTESRRGLRLLPRRARPLRVLLVGALRLVPGDRQGAALRRRSRREPRRCCGRSSRCSRWRTRSCRS